MINGRKAYALLGIFVLIDGLTFSIIDAKDFSGSVVSVLDGDTIEVLHNSKPERIRLSGIDCPEKSQAYGNNAKQAASALAFGKEVTFQTHGYDKYQCTLGDVILPDGMHFNQELVKQGWSVTEIRSWVTAASAVNWFKSFFVYLSACETSRDVLVSTGTDGSGLVEN